MPIQAHIELEDHKLAMHFPHKSKALILVFSVQQHNKIIIMAYCRGDSQYLIKKKKKKKKPTEKPQLLL